MNESGFSSGSSRLSCEVDSPPLISLQKTVVKTLKSRIFLGRYLERRLVSEAVGYRDIILISPAEEELQRDLLDVTKWLQHFYPKTHWIGITDGELGNEYKPGVWLWTEIDDKPFGAFWFQVRTVQFRSNEVIVNVKCLRHISERFLELEPFLVKSGKLIKTNDSNSKEIISDSFAENYKTVLAEVKNYLTLRSIKDGVFFIVALVIALITGSFALVSYLGTFVLSLLRELSLLVQNSTPLFLGCLDFVSKIVGGFYILIAMIFRQTTHSPPPSRYVEYENNHRYRYDDKERDTTMKNFD